MQITLAAAPNITVNPGKQGKGSWKKMEVLYKNQEGRVSTKTLVSFKNPTVFKTFAEAKQGEVYEVESVQSEPDAEGKQYWEWKSAHVVGGQSEGPVVDTSGTPAKPVAKMVVTEADRNRYIVRQSSLERAIETLAGNGVFTAAQACVLAERYEAWVFRPVGAPVEAANSNVVAPVAESKPRGRPRKVAAPEGTEFVDTTEVE